MARRPRIFVAGLSVHVIHRGNNGIAVFHDDADRHLYLHYVREAMARNRVETHGFTLMSTHWHGLVTPSTKTALQLAMKRIGERYVRHFNRKYDRFGGLWNDRYRALPVADDIYWLTCLRYIEQNPVRAGIVSMAEAYPWSSYRAHAFGEGPDWLAIHHVYQSLGRTDLERQRNYRAICGVMLTDEELAVQRHPARPPIVEPNAPAVLIGV